MVFLTPIALKFIKEAFGACIISINFLASINDYALTLLI